MTALIYRVLYCNCGEPIPLLQDALARLFADPKHLTSDSHEIAALCLRCKLVGKHQLERTSDVPLNREMAVLEAPDKRIDAAAETASEIMLRCVEAATCKSLLPLMRQRKDGIDEKAWSEYRSTWRFDGLTCPRGHTIHKPIDW